MLGSLKDIQNVPGALSKGPPINHNFNDVPIRLDYASKADG